MAKSTTRAPARRQSSRSHATPATRPRRAVQPRAVPATAEPTAPASVIGDVLDRAVHASLAPLTGGLSSPALVGAYLDWAAHLASSPGKRMELMDKASRKTARFLAYAGRCALEGPDAEPCIEPLPQDRRFAGEAWQHWPYNLAYQGFLLSQQWWHNATTGIRGVTTQDENAVAFGARQALDMMSPSNFLATNPEVLERTAREGGMNLVRGCRNLLEDWQRHGGRQAPGRRRGVPGRPRRRDDARQGDLPQPPDRADPVCADDREGAARAGADRAGLDHEVLHPRPLRAELAGPLPGRPGLHRLHDLVAEPGRGGPRSGHGGLSPVGCHGGTRCRVGRSCPRRPCHAAGYCLGGTLLSIAACRHGPRRGHAPGLGHPARRPDRLHRGGRIDALRQRGPDRLPRGHDVGAGLSRHHADGRRLPAPALERPRSGRAWCATT